MKRVLTFLFAAVVAISCSQARADLIISEVVDATLPGGLPKFVEITNTGNSSVDLSGFSVGNFNNGGLTLGGGASTDLSGLLAAGDSYVISYETPDSDVFVATYGFAPDLSIGPFTNGDDVYALFQGPATGDGSDATLIDVYGVIGVDGTGTAWEYTDGFSFRNPDSISSMSTFVESQWTFGGANSLEDPGGDDVVELGLILANTTPGTHNFNSGAIPEPGSFAFLGLIGLVGLGQRRRK